MNDRNEPLFQGIIVPLVTPLTESILTGPLLAAEPEQKKRIEEFLKTFDESCA